MNVWIVLAAVASTAITALLTWWLYRLNATTDPQRQPDDVGDAGILAGGRHSSDSNGDGGADGGGD